MRSENDELRSRLTALSAENAALREDKARLDWIDENPTVPLVPDPSIRLAIDAARAAEGEEG